MNKFNIRNIEFSTESEENGSISFLDVKISRQDGKFVTSVYRKPTLSGVYTHFDSFIQDKYKFGMVYAIIYRCFRIFSSPQHRSSRLKGSIS